MDKQKADALITEYLPKVYGFSMKKSFSYDEAEELCADIILELYRSFLSSAEIHNLDGYVWRISNHVFSKFVSSKKKHQGISIDGMELVHYDEYFPDDDDEALRLRREISFLTESRRKIVYSYYYENKTVSAISAAMKLPVGTVKWHLSKARNDLKEGFTMERKIGRLGLNPIEATGFGHSGDPGSNGGPEFYLGDRLNLNIVYSVYHEPRTRDEIAGELGVSPVYIDDRIAFLEENGFLVRQAQKRYTTYVRFDPETFSLEEQENRLKKQLEIAEIFAKEYVPEIRRAVADYPDVYIPGGNRELFEAFAVFYAIACKCQLNVPAKKGDDISRYCIRTTDGGCFNAHVDLAQKQSDPDYVPTLDERDLYTCGYMGRWSEKYPILAWSVDSKYCSRKGGWKNNLVSDYEAVYELMTGAIRDDQANAEKFARMRERGFITEDNKVNIMVAKGSMDDFYLTLPKVDEKIVALYADYAFETAEIAAKSYPPQMRELIVCEKAGTFINETVAVMVMDILYGNGTFRPLTENEKVTSNLLMFADRLPE